MLKNVKEKAKTFYLFQPNIHSHLCPCSRCNPTPTDLVSWFPHWVSPTQSRQYSGMTSASPDLPGQSEKRRRVLPLCVEGGAGSMRRLSSFLPPEVPPAPPGRRTVPVSFASLFCFVFVVCFYTDNKLCKNKQCNVYFFSMYHQNFKMVKKIYLLRIFIWGT